MSETIAPPIPVPSDLDSELKLLLELAEANPDKAKLYEAAITARVDFLLLEADRDTDRSDRDATKIKAASAHIAELAYRQAATLAHESGKPSRSGKSRARWRADKRRDEEIFKFVTGLLRVKQPVRVTDMSAHTVIIAKSELARARIEARSVIPEVGLPHWDHADAKLKMLAWGMASWEMGATPFTLRLNELVIENAKSDKRGPARHLQDRIARHLRNRLGAVSPFWFAIETSLMSEAHLHGAIVIPTDRESSVADALRAAGGPWRSKARQLMFSPRRGAATWVSYATKWFYGTKGKFEGGNTTGATNDIRSAAREWHQSARGEGKVLYPT